MEGTEGCHEKVFVYHELNEKPLIDFKGKKRHDYIGIF